MNINLNTTIISSQITPLFAYLQKQRENKKVTRLFEIGATLFFISFFVFFAIKPTLLTISSLVGEIKSKELLSKELKGKIDDIIAAQDLFSQVQERYYLVESSLPQNPHFYLANSHLFTLSQNHQVPLNKLDYIVSDSDYFATSISTSSSYLSAISLISDILNSRRLIDINAFSFSLSKDNLDQEIKINLPLKIYYWKNDVKK